MTTQAVQYPLNEYADNPFTFHELPDWLTTAVQDETIRAEFRGEDYWYLIVKTPQGDATVAPDDWIVRDAQGSLSVRKTTPR